MVRLSNIPLPKLWLIILLVLCKSTGFASKGFFNQLWLREGLSQSTVNCVVRDSLGFIWLGTQDGLSRFDGKKLEPFNFIPYSNKGLSGDNIYALASKGDFIWVLNSGGLDKINIRNLSITHIKLTTTGNGKPPGEIRRMWLANNSVWVYARGYLGYFNLEDEGKLKSINLNAISDKPLACYDATVLNGSLYFVTNKGLISVDKGTGTSTLVALPSEIQKQKLNPFIITVGNLLVMSSQNQLYFFQPANKTFNKLQIGNESIDNITCYSMVSPEEVWVGTSGDGLFVLNKVDALNWVVKDHFNSESTANSLSCNAISCLLGLPGNKRSVWIGSRDAGAFYYNKSNNLFKDVSTEAAILKNNYFGLAQDKEGNIWAGCNNGMYCISNKGTIKSFMDYTHETGNVERPIEAVGADAQGVVWMALDNTIYYGEPKSGRMIVKYKDILPVGRNHIFRIKCPAGNKIYLGCEQGFIILDKQNGSFQLVDTVYFNGVPQRLQQIGAFLFDEEGNLWLGTVGGVLVTDSKYNVIKKFSYEHGKQGILSNVIMDIAQIGRNDIIISTTKGMSRIVKKGKDYAIENIFNTESPRNNFIYGVLKDEAGNLWMSTNFGIARYSLKDKLFRIYGPEEGLRVTEYNSAAFFKCKDGSLLFGGIGGITRFNPQDFIEEISNPGVILKDIGVLEDGKLITFYSQESIDLNYRQNDIALSFALPETPFSGRMELVYRIENMATGWIKASSDYRILFNNLAPDSYRIEVAARSSDGRISNKRFKLNIVVAPPFWKTEWFILGGILAISLFIYLVYKNRLAAKIRLEQRMQTIRQEEQEKVRAASALDLHDEFGNGLTRISMLVAMAKVKMGNQHGELTQLLDNISDQTSRLYTGTKDFIWSINKGNDNLFEVIARIKDFSEELFMENGVTFVVEGINEESKKLRIDPSRGRNLVLLFKEAVSNVAKHSRANRVELKLNLIEDGVIVVSLTDNGVGIAEGALASGKGYGVSGMKQRCNRMKAEFNLTSRTGEGTIISVRLKLQEAVA